MEKPHEMVVIGCFELVLDDDEVIAITGKYVYSPAVGELVFDSDLVCGGAYWLTSRVPGRRASCRGWARRAPGTFSGRGSPQLPRCRCSNRRLI